MDKLILRGSLLSRRQDADGISGAATGTSKAQPMSVRVELPLTVT
jgi:hypothetical protein